MDTARALTAFMLIPIAMLLHAFAAWKLGWFEQWPLWALVMIAAAVIVLLRMLIRLRPLRKGLLALNIAAWVLAGFFLWWTQVYSAYGEMQPTVPVDAVLGERVKLSGLRDPQGGEVDLAAQLALSKATLLVFYRGDW